MRFAVTARVRRPRPPRPPVARVPHYDHVFLFVFENQNYRTVVGNRRQAPFLNGLIAHGSLRANAFAEEHPSDVNYLAIEGGSAFNVPLTNPLEENNHYTIHATGIEDRIIAAHETWKSYFQDAIGPCDDTVHQFYWDDDMSALYFDDIRNRRAYCAAHVVPLEQLQADLQSAATTQSFSRIAANDCQA